MDNAIENETEIPKHTDEPELKLPNWIKPDPEAGEKGKLLYIEEWAMKRKFFEPHNFIMGLTIFAIGIAIPVVWGINDGIFSLKRFCGSSVFALFPVLIGVWMTIDLYKRFPLCIYQHGFSLTEIPATIAIVRKEVFVPWKQLDRIELIQVVNDERMTVTKFVYGGEKELWVPTDEEFDTMELFKVLSRVIPKKVDSKIAKLIDFNDQLQIPEHVEKPIGLFGELPILLLQLSFVFVTLMMLHSYFSSGETTIFLLFSIVFFSFPYIMMYAFVNDPSFHDLNVLIKCDAQLQEDRIQFGRTIQSKILNTVYNHIPLDEIHTVRLKLRNLLYDHIGQIETSSGEKFLVPIELYKKKHPSGAI